MKNKDRIQIPIITEACAYRKSSRLFHKYIHEASRIRYEPTKHEYYCRQAYNILHNIGRDNPMYIHKLDGLHKKLEDEVHMRER